MIKPINVSPLDTTNQIYFECKNCGKKDTIFFTNRVINVDKKVDLEEIEQQRCPYCDALLGGRNDKELAESN